MVNTTGKKFGGRQKGTKNRIDEAIRAQFEFFVRSASDDIQELFAKLKEENPKQALDAIRDYAEFVLPKLQRVEQKIEGEININTALANLEKPQLSKLDDLEVIEHEPNE